MIRFWWKLGKIKLIQSIYEEKDKRRNENVCKLNFRKIEKLKGYRWRIVGLGIAFKAVHLIINGIFDAILIV